jgi:Tfp pilus assembly protein PilO
MNLQPRERKLVVVAVIAVVLFTGFYFIAPLWSRQSGGDDLQRVQKELRRQKELIAATKQMQNQTGALQAKLADDERRLVAPGDLNKASAELQGWVVQQAAAHQLDIIRSEFLPAAPLGGLYVRIPVQFEFNGQMTQLVQFFDALQKGEKIIALEDMQINSTGAKDKRVRCVVVVTTLMPKVN